MIWQTRLGRCIYTSVSGYKVYDNFFFRWLTLGSDALQTVLNTFHPQKPVLYYLPAMTLMVKAIPETYCLLGLGGAGLPHLLKGHRGVAVEYSEEVVEIAKAFFMVDQIQGLDIVRQNASDFVRENTQKFGHLLIDLYGADHYPEECMNEAFFADCKRCLDPNGFMAVNVANYKEQKNIYDLIKKEFKNTLVIPIKKCANVIILASPMEHSEVFLNLIRASGGIRQVVWLEEWGHVGY